MASYNAPDCSCYMAPFLSQEDVKIKKKEFKTGIDIGFKEAWKSIKEGDKYFKQGKGTFDLARDLYLFANQYNPENADLNYKIGACYLFTDDKYEAIYLSPEGLPARGRCKQRYHLLLGQAYHLVLEFDRCRHEHYNAHKENLKGDELIEYTEVLTKKLTECQHGSALSQEPVRVIIKNLGRKC